MDKSFIVFVAVGIGFFYMITNFVGKIENEDIQPQDSKGYIQDYKTSNYDQYIIQDIIGRDVLDIEGLDRQQQIDIWKHCSLREDFISYFPDYEEMIKFVKERVISKEFQKYLIKKIEAIENDFLMGNIDSDEALRKVRAL